MAAFSSWSSSPSPVRSCLYDVFLSFSGVDTRNAFTSHLLAALNRQGFSTFRDDAKLERGEDICSQLPKAISESRVSIVVFSKNYAASGWCLNELVKIMECRRDFKQIVMPIFYDVNPSDVRKQSGCYAKAFKVHEDRFRGSTSSMERVIRWKEALTQSANLSGWDLQNLVNRDEAKLIKIVVEELINRLDRLYSSVADHPVGIDSRVHQFKSMLKLGSDDVRIVAIWGVGGIGKTTLAKAIFNCICRDFESSSFLADVSETSKTFSGLVALQKQLLSNILMNETHNLDNYHQGIEVIRRKLSYQRVLLVLDDVDHVQQLKMLAINRDLFSKGSRIIITTRNMSSLTSLQVDSVYSPAELNNGESLKLFSLNAFKSNHPEEGYFELSKEVVAYARGLPLALEVLGSFFSGRNKAEWRSALRKLEKHPHSDIQGKLKLSFESLDNKDQELLLDIAFFFIGRDKDFTVKLLEDSECFPEIGIGELARRCLVRVDEYNKLRMHNVLRDMAREIVYQESLKEPGKRSRLRGHKEVLQVLRDCTGTKAIEGIYLELSELNDEHVNALSFVNMHNLRLLHLNYLCHLRGTHVAIPRKLKWLCWHRFPLACIPTDLYMGDLVAIDLQYSSLKEIWKGPKTLYKLRFLNLSYSRLLTKTPDFSGLKSLEELWLHDCTNLVEVHYSIGFLDKLVILNMANCKNLRKVPSTISMLKSLQDLDLSGCSKLNELARSKGPLSMFWQLLSKPQECTAISAASIQGLSCLQKLNLAWCNISYVPSEIGSLVSLEHLSLSGNKFNSLPSNFSNLSRLKSLFLHDCQKLQSLPDLPNNLELLGAVGCKSLEFESVGAQFGKVKWMSFEGCPKLDDNNFEKIIIECQPGSETILFLPVNELPRDLHFQGTGLSFSYVVHPHFDQIIQVWILCTVVYEQRYNFVEYEAVPENDGTNTHDHPRMEDRMSILYCDMGNNTGSSFYWRGRRADFLWFNHVAVSDDDACNLEQSDDQMELTNWSDRPSATKFGIRLVYKGDDKDLESKYRHVAHD